MKVYRPVAIKINLYSNKNKPMIHFMIEYEWQSIFYSIHIFSYVYERYEYEFSVKFYSINWFLHALIFHQRYTNCYKSIFYFQLISKISTCLQTRCNKIFCNHLAKRDCRVETIMMEPNTVMVVSPDVVQQGQEISQA